MSKINSLLAPIDTQAVNYPSGSSTPIINTPPSGGTSPRSAPASRRTSTFRPILAKARVSPPPDPRHQAPSIILQAPPDGKKLVEGRADDLDFSDEERDMGDIRAPLHRTPTDGRSSVPLLKDERGGPSYETPNGSTRPAFVAKRSTFRSHSPDMEGSSATRKKYTYAGFFLLLSLISFTIQTETAVYIQHELKWNKAYAMLCAVTSTCTHGP